VTTPSETKTPERIAALPVFRGEPVPWFVAYPDGPEGEPEFRIADRKKWILAVQQNVCWICGQRLDAYLAFVLEPSGGITRTTIEPACHRDCAEWAICHAPLRKTGVSLLWATRSFSLVRGTDQRYQIRVGDPIEVLCFIEGRRATRQEIDEAIAEVMPQLLQEDEADVRQQVAELEFYLPVR
jgi:hypothetical protein